MRISILFFFGKMHVRTATLVWRRYFGAFWQLDGQPKQTRLVVVAALVCSELVGLAVL